MGKERFPFLLGRYRVVEKLGGGAQGDVYLAFREGPMGFRLKVALKTVKSRSFEPTRLVKAIANEARTLAATHHPNVVKVFDFAHVGKTYLLALEYVEGIDLSMLMRHVRARGTSLSEAETLQIAEQIAAGLGCVHELVDHAGKPSPMVHRDLKPANVMLTQYGLVKLADFGLAKGNLIAFHTVEAGITRGTPGYMSPEQCQGQALTPASDQFSLGSLIYEMLTGEPLFRDKSASATMLRVMKFKPTGDLAKVRQKCPPLFSIVKRCLAMGPADRYERTSELAKTIRELRINLGLEADLASLVKVVRSGRESGEMPAIDKEAPDVSEDEASSSTSDFFFGADPKTLPEAAVQQLDDEIPDDESK